MLDLFDDDRSGGIDYADPDDGAFGLDYAADSAGQKQMNDLCLKVESRVMDKVNRQCFDKHAVKTALLRLRDDLRREVREAKQAAFNERLDADSKARMLPQVFLGMDSATVAGFAAGVPAGGAVVIPEQPNSDFRVTDFIASIENPTDFQITQITIARLTLLLSGTGIPMDIFTTGVQRPPIETPKLRGGVPLSINVLNIATAARRFRGSFIGIDCSRTFDVTAPN